MVGMVLQRGDGLVSGSPKFLNSIKKVAFWDGIFAVGVHAHAFSLAVMCYSKDTGNVFSNQSGNPEFNNDFLTNASPPTWTSRLTARISKRRWFR